MSRVYTETCIAVYPEMSRFKANMVNYDYLSPLSYQLRLILTFVDKVNITTFSCIETEKVIS